MTTPTKDLSPQQKKLLSLLEDREWHLGPELNGLMYRYSGRIHELRRLGYDIEGERVGKGLWRYRLVETPQQVVLKKRLERTEAVVAAQRRLL